MSLCPCRTRSPTRPSFCSPECAKAALAEHYKRPEVRPVPVSDGQEKAPSDACRGCNRDWARGPYRPCPTCRAADRVLRIHSRGRSKKEKLLGEKGWLAADAVTVRYADCIPEDDTEKYAQLDLYPVYRQILRLRLEGATYDAIARELGCTKALAGKVCRRFADEIDAVLNPKPPPTPEGIAAAWAEWRWMRMQQIGSSAPSPFDEDVHESDPPDEWVRFHFGDIDFENEDHTPERGLYGTRCIKRNPTHHVPGDNLCTPVDGGETRRLPDEASDPPEWDLGVEE